MYNLRNLLVYYIQLILCILHIATILEFFIHKKFINHFCLSSVAANAWIGNACQRSRKL